MKKGKILALVLAGVMCMTSSNVFATGSYNVNHGSKLGSDVITIGQLNSPTLFYGSTTWNCATGTVMITAKTYTTNIETGELVDAQTGTSAATNKCTIDQTHSSFTTGTYSIARVSFTHKIFDPKLVELGETVWSYNRTLNY